MPIMLQPSRAPKNSYRWVRRKLQVCQPSQITDATKTENRNLLLVGSHAVSRHGWRSQDRLRTAAIEEVDRDTGLTAAIARGKSAVEVRQQVDGGAVDHTRRKDTRDRVVVDFAV